jgi:hypothetical protein
MVPAAFAMGRRIDRPNLGLKGNYPGKHLNWPKICFVLVRFAKIILKRTN